MADMNYVSPLTSDLTDYYTKSEVDELQQGDAATYATSAEIVAGDNAVKGWVVSQGFLTEHQDLTNYATISYVDDAIDAIEPSSGGMAVRVVSTLPGVGEENVLYLVFVNNEEEENRYAEYIWVDTLNDYEMLGYGSSEGGIIPDLTDYATKQWVEAKGYLTAIDAKDVSYDNAASGLEAANVKNAIDEVYNYAATGLNNLSASSIMYDNSNSGLAAMGVQSAIDEVSAKVAAIDIPDVSDFIDAEQAQSIAADEVEYKMGTLSTVAVSGSYNDLTDKPTIPAAPDLTPYATKQELTAKADSASLASVATSGDYDDLTNKPTIPVLPTLATVATSGSYNDLSDKPTLPTFDFKVRTYFPLLSSDGFVLANSKADLVSALKQGGIVKYSYYSIAADITFQDDFDVERCYVYQLTSNKTYNNFPSSNPYLSYSIPSNSYVMYIPPGNSSARGRLCYSSDITYFNQWFVNINGIYSNTTSGLTATSIQGAIDELAAASGGGASTAAQLSYDNTNTWNDGTDTDTVQEAIDTLWNEVDGVSRTVAELPDGYDLTETYNANTKTLNLSITASSGL